jgi:hypothetical protein
MKKLILFTLVFASSIGSYAQYRINAGASVGAGATMFSLGAEREFNVINEKFHLNPGVRVNVFNGKDLEYITAPAKYTKNDDQVDTLTFKAVQNNFANLYVRLGYDISKKISVSFDIDVVGVSFGAEQAYSDFKQGKALKAGPQTTFGHSEKGSPTTFNLLLVGDNDLGSLNSTLRISYDVTNKLGIDLGAGLVFTEYTIASGRGYDGNDRFRNKNIMGYLGLSYLLGEK